MPSWNDTFFPQIIPDECHETIRNHKYVPGVKSWTMPYLNYWWEFFVTLIPMSVAPNVITLIGISAQLSAFIIYIYCDPYLTGANSSSLMFIYQALALFIYQTLDACDGKHARRTQNSSPLGQLFDHGCDAFLITYSVLPHGGILALGTGYKTLYCVILAQIVFYALNWRARHTGKFDFGKFSIDETLLTGMAAFLLTAVYGTSFWQFKPLFGYITVHHQLMIFLTVAVGYNCIKASWAVYIYYDKQDKTHFKFYQDRYWEIGNVFVFHLSLLLWNTCGVLNKYPSLFFISIGCTFGHLVHRLIICDVTKMKSRKIQYIIFPYVGAAILSMFELYNIQILPWNISMADIEIMYFVLIYSSYIMFNYGIRCLLDISNVLNIRIFVINPPKVHKK